MKTSKNIAQVLILFVLFVQLFSCDSSLVFEQNQEFSNKIWHKDSIVTFSFETDSIYAKEIRFAINLRNTVDYPYRNLWVFMDLATPNSVVKRDTLNLFLMNEQGYWLDNIKGGRIKESKHYYRYKLANPKAGTYKITLQQGMRTNALSEIVSIGTRIEKIN